MIRSWTKLAVASLNEHPISTDRDQVAIRAAPPHVVLRY
jgi:hypothetical protein